jgi:hypothetical protein
MATTTGPGLATIPGVRQTHPRLVARAPTAQPIGWSQDDTLFVVLLLAAVVMCALVPLALL